MAHPFWSGQLRISLVSFGINLIPAIESRSEIRFHQIDRQSGERIRHQKVSSGDDEPVEKADIVKGYEYSKGEFIQLEQSEIENLRIASRHTIELEQFVPAREIDPAFFEKPYFVLPESPAQTDAFAVVREALLETKTVGLGKVAIGGRERLIAITAPTDSSLPGMMAFTLRFASELRNAGEYFDEIKKTKVDGEQLDLAKELIRKRSSPFKPEKFTDDYEAALRELIDAKLKHVTLPKQAKEASRGKVVNLMDALRRSVGEPAAAKKLVVRADGKPARERISKSGLRLMKSNRVEKPRRTA